MEPGDIFGIEIGFLSDKCICIESTQKCSYEFVNYMYAYAKQTAHKNSTNIFP